MTLTTADWALIIPHSCSEFPRSTADAFVFKALKAASMNSNKLLANVPSNALSLIRHLRLDSMGSIPIGCEIQRHTGRDDGVPESNSKAVSIMFLQCCWIRQWLNTAV
jgi:hypothetical protein